MAEIKQTSIKLPKEMLIKIKALAVEKETTQNNIITDLLAESLNITGTKQEKMKSRIINHEMMGYDPDKKLNSKDMIGIVKVNNAEDIDVQELKDSIHFKKELY